MFPSSDNISKRRCFPVAGGCSGERKYKRPTVRPSVSQSVSQSPPQRIFLAHPDLEGKHDYRTETRSTRWWAVYGNGSSLSLSLSVDG